MKVDRIETDDGISYLAFSVGETDKVDPTAYYEDYFLRSRFILYCELIHNGMIAKSVHISKKDIEIVAARNSFEDWQNLKKVIYEIPIPEEFKKLLCSEKKKQQIQLLKNFKVTPFELLAYTFYAFKHERYLLTQVIGEHDPIGTESSKKPSLIHVDGEEVVTVGETDLSKGQLKQIVDQRKKTIARILERDNEWHCFFTTYGSLRGDESWKDGQPHFHYISDKFGIAKEVLIEQLKSRHYKLGTLPHIDLVGMNETKK